MARVPTWQELRIDAIELVHLQKECYRSVHDLLDTGIPELDKKILALNNYDVQPKKVSAHNPILPMSVSPLPSPMPDEMDAEEWQEPEQKLPRKIANNIVSQPQNGTTHKRKVRAVNPTQNGFKQDVPHPIKASKTFPSLNNYNDLDKLEHLRPLPMPLCEYLKLNRPELVMRADRRVMYLKKISEKRKASSKLINSLEQIRVSSRNSRNSNHYNHNTYNIHNSQHIKQAPRESKDYLAPDYSVKCRLSEKEMKKLTAKTYKRLPEVKRKLNEEVTNHMRAQNYKNKLNYGLKLLENRRRGIINYPLRSSYYDDRSIITTSSSLDDFSINGERAADAFKSVPYY